MGRRLTSLCLTRRFHCGRERPARWSFFSAFSGSGCRETGPHERDARAHNERGREIHAPIHSKVCKPFTFYGVGITAWVWFENALSFPAPSTAVVT
jgi:hypothetical protein